MADLIAGDVGVLIKVTVDDNISDASAIQLILCSPAGETKTVTAALQAGSNTIVEYTTAAGIIDKPGTWKGQVRVVQSSKTRRSSVFTLSVDPAL